MDSLAKAILETAAFLELSGEEAINPDAAVRALEDLGFLLSGCTPDEKAALKRAAQSLASEGADEERRRFFGRALQDLGVEET